MTDATKASILLFALTFGLVACGYLAARQARARSVAERQAVLFEGEANAARKAEVQAKADRAAADQREAAVQVRVAHLEAALAKHPVPPPAEPVPADASGAVVVAGLQSLGLTPHLVGEDLALSLPDGRITLGWGREFLRVPQLNARLSSLEALTQAQTHQSEAQRQQLAAADQTITAADARADAQQHRAEALQEALRLSPKDRPWSAGLLVGMDTSGARRTGAYASRAWGPAQVQVVFLGNQAAVGGGIRF